MAYFTNTELAIYVGQEVSNENYLKWHDFAKQRIENYCAQEFEKNSYTESRRMDNVIFLLHQPVTSVTSVKDSFNNEVDNSAYDFYSWGVSFETNLEVNSRKVTIDYTAGWEKVPEPIKQLALWMAKKELVPSDVPTGIENMSSNGVTISPQKANLQANKLTGNDYWDTIANQYRIKVKVS